MKISLYRKTEYADHLLVMNGYTHTGGNLVTTTDKVVTIVCGQDAENFWPTIILLEKDEAVDLIKAIQKAIDNLENPEQVATQLFNGVVLQ